MSGVSRDEIERIAPRSVEKVALLPVLVNPARIMGENGLPGLRQVALAGAKVLIAQA